ncbi:MAG: S-methyl-5'-thioadenosine phosphorylase [Bdellovibrionales bacterium]|nr:S-methyl-5'-thioadenosine phosphorylase [Bdellovibrionales bacterium]
MGEAGATGRQKTIVGVIGGTGLYELPGLVQVEQINVDTPFGAPSSPITRGLLDGVEFLFLSRHAPGHVLLPSEINYRANIFALKLLGAQWCISVSAVGSLREEIAPGDIVLPEQLIDRTRGRSSTFFGNGIVAHIPFADPFCPTLNNVLRETALSLSREQQFRVHTEATYVVMEGPAFSTRAESHLYRSWGASIIGMTGLPEAKLAREAELSYAVLAMSTDYDCWRSETADVDVPDLLETMQRNVVTAKAVLRAAAPRLLASTPSLLAANALQHAIITDPAVIPAEVKEKLSPLIGRYIN